MHLVDKPLALRLLNVGALAVAIAVVAGIATGGTVYGLLMADASDDGWAELGAAIFGLGAGVVIGAVVYAVAVVVGIHRTQPVGQRVRPAVALVLLPLTLVVAAGAPSAAAGAYSPQIGVGIAFIAFVSAVFVAHAGIAGAASGRHAAIAFVSLAALGVGSTATTAMLAERGERAATRDGIEGLGVLPLVDGHLLDGPYPGWQVRRVHYSKYSQAIDVTWDLPGDGDAHLSVDPTTGYQVRVHAADGIAIERDLTRRLQPVTAAAFLEACGRHC
jgi:hypothetical protein